MEHLVNYFDKKELDHIICIDSSLLDMSDEDIEESLNLLGKIGLEREAIKEIIYVNPYYLSRSIEDIEKLIEKLHSLEIEDIPSLFESNPWLLNKDAFEIDEYMREQISLGRSFEEVVEDISTGIFF